MVTVSPLKPEGVSDWFGKKLDWNPAFIPSSHRPAPPPRTLAPDPSLSLEEGYSRFFVIHTLSLLTLDTYLNIWHSLSEEPTARTVKVENGEYLLLVPPSRKLHIPSATLPESESSTHTLRSSRPSPCFRNPVLTSKFISRTLSEENVRHTGQKGVSDTSGTTSDGETQDQDVCGRFFVPLVSCSQMWRSCRTWTAPSFLERRNCLLLTTWMTPSRLSQTTPKRTYDTFVLSSLSA